MVSNCEKSIWFMFYILLYILAKTYLNDISNVKLIGFTDKDMNELKGIFTDTNLYFLGLTFAISVLHVSD